MLPKEDRLKLAFFPIVVGAFTVLLIMILFAVFLGILTQFGWTGTIKWGGNLYLIVIYISITVGAVTAGLKSNRQGWITGAGVGCLSSCFIIILAWIAGENISWPLYLVKTFINSFIGAFGGIIGVNFAGND